MSTVIVTQADYPKAKAIYDAADEDGLQCIPAPDDEAHLADAIRQNAAAYAIVGVTRYVGVLYDALPRGGVLARFGVGHDGIDKARATAAGILCTNTPGVLDDSVAEHTIALILAVARHLGANAHSARRGEWTPHVGTELRGKTLAVIGCGPIGLRVAQIAAFGFGMHVVGCEIRGVDPAEMKHTHGIARVTADFADAVSDADVVSLHIPSTPATRHFQDADRIGQIPAGAVLVNTARGAVVLEPALYEALEAGRLAAAALDVFDQEPYVPSGPAADLRTLPNVLMTPHVASSTREACDRMARRALRNIQLAIDGAYDQMDLLNPEVVEAL